MASAHERTLQELFILATGKVAGTPDLSALEALVAPDGGMLQVNQAIDRYLGLREQQMGKAGVLLSIAKDGLGLTLTTAQAEAVLNDLASAGLRSWSSILQWAAASTSGKVADILNNRGEAALHFIDLLQSAGKAALFSGQSVAAGAANVLQSIGAPASSLAAAKQAFSDLAGNMSTAGLAGAVADGYVVGANISADADGDGLPDWTDGDNDGQWDAGEGEWFGITGASGNYNLPMDAPAGVIRASGGTDLLTNRPFLGVLSAPAGAAVVNPFTTLVQALVANGSTVTAASAAVQSTLGLSADLNVLT
jgi:hypothetical protein